jgi:hypothetical protein
LLKKKNTPKIHVFIGVNLTALPDIFFTYSIPDFKHVNGWKWIVASVTIAVAVATFKQLHMFLIKGVAGAT